MAGIDELPGATQSPLRLRRSTDRRVVALDLISRELREGGWFVLRAADVSARWSLDLDTAMHLLDHLSSEGLLGSRGDGAYESRESGSG